MTAGRGSSSRGTIPGEHAARVAAACFAEPGLQASLGAEAAHRALRFTWDVTADEVAASIASFCRA